jgi:hypothetical protein
MAEAAVATTTLEQDKHTASQRNINRVWEYTQSFLAISVIVVVLGVNASVAIYGKSVSEISSSALMQLNVLGALVVGFYFGRTNHQRVGGVDVGR